MRVRFPSPAPMCNPGHRPGSAAHSRECVPGMTKIAEWSLNKLTTGLPRSTGASPPCLPRSTRSSEVVRSSLDSDHFHETFRALEVVWVGRVERELVARRRGGDPQVRSTFAWLAP